MGKFYFCLALIAVKAPNQSTQVLMSTLLTIRPQYNKLLITNIILTLKIKK